MKDKEWYELNHPEEIDSPALLIYKDRVSSNIKKMIEIAGDPLRLAPHVKTHKMREIVKMCMAEGIQQFKCATIAEAEMLVEAGAKNILLAYQLTGPKINRFISLKKEFPDIHFASLIDNTESADVLNDLSAREGIISEVYIDVDSGMHRTGIAPGEELLNLYKHLKQLKNIDLKGLHIYDGHIDDVSYDVRKKRSDTEFDAVYKVVDKIVESGFPFPKIIVGGCPTFTIHCLDKRLCYSPGTSVLWDYGYDLMLAEQSFDYAAVLLNRVISKPKKGLITIDLGYKAVASENELSKRVYFLNLKDYQLHSQSEEHLVIEVKDDNPIHIGDVIYGVPYHVCPTVALYEDAFVIQNADVIDKWKVVARNRKITV